MITLQDIRNKVAHQLQIDSNEILDDDNLMMLGLDSVSLMTLVGDWRDQGFDIEFQDLAEEPTLVNWLDKLSKAATH